MIANVYGDPASPAHASKNALLCNAAKGVIDTAVRMGVISTDEASVTAHPHPARRPGTAPTEQQVHTRFPSNGSPGASWGTVTISLSEHADFANYVVGPAVRKISLLPISHERPTPASERRERPRQLRPSRIRAFRAGLPTAVRDVIGTAASVRKLLDHDWVARQVLNDKQYQLLRACNMPPPRDEQLFDTGQDKEWAARWILARLAALGWNPARFGEFDRNHGRGARDAHKAERIGKKYQWMALHELGERLVNHYHLNTGYEDEQPDPVAEWQMWLRDIDPSLPPTPHRLADEDDPDETADADPRSATFAPSQPTGFWMPPQPALPDLDHVEYWIADGGPLPNLEQVAVRVDEHGARWVVLGEYASDTADGCGFSGQQGQAEQWHHIDSWLVRQSQFEATLGFLNPRMLVPRWMPEARRPSRIYLGEFPEAPAAYDPYNGEPGPKHELHFVDYYAADDRSGATGPEQHSAPPRGVLARRSLPRLLSSGHSKETLLGELARLWSPGHWPPTGEVDDHGDDDDFAESNLIDRLFDPSLPANAVVGDPGSPSYAEVGRDGSGAALQALPATQYYGWEASGADCSIDAHVNVHIPANALLAGAALVRHPDRTDWYDAARSHVVTSRWTRRATGEIMTLLVREDWLDARLTELGFTLVVGLFGNRLPATTEFDITKVGQWREYSQVAGRAPAAQWRYGTICTRLKHAAR